MSMPSSQAGSCAARACWPDAAETDGRVLHLDLHPGNVMLTSRGPVVIDWSNARSGAGGADVAMAYILLSGSELRDLPRYVRLAIGLVRGAFVRHFLHAVHDDPGPRIAPVGRDRMADPNVRPSEVIWLVRKVAEAEQGQPSR